MHNSKKSIKKDTTQDAKKNTKKDTNKDGIKEGRQKRKKKEKKSRNRGIVSERHWNEIQINQILLIELSAKVQEIKNEVCQEGDLRSMYVPLKFSISCTYSEI